MTRLSRVSSKFGAPMGRPDTPNAYSEYAAIPDAAHKFSLRRVPINSGGYDSGGAYWGLGQPLYVAENQSGAVTRFFRARDREAAKAYLRGEFPNCSFYR